MHICYIDESGTPDIPGNTSHYILAGFSVPINRWKYCDRAIENIKRRYGLIGSEIHVAWMLRRYIEQNRINDFSDLDWQQRRTQVSQARTAELLRLQRSRNIKQYRQTKKNFTQTKDYIHLTYQERFDFIIELATMISRWSFARLFAECIDKVYFDPSRGSGMIDEQAFEQVVSRFEHYLQNIGRNDPNCRGLLIHDNNPTVAKRHTMMMKRFHDTGTMWTSVDKIIETPLFVDSQLTGMVQIADLCAYSLRRYLENNERVLFDLVISRADRRVRARVGVRHFTQQGCGCDICAQHTATLAPKS
jgi:hypothetical protein